MDFLQLCESLESEIIASYDEGITLADAEKLSAKFLHAQMRVSKELYQVDLDSRMRKSGVKAIRAAVYLDGATKGDKKPSDVLLQAMVDVDAIVISEQQAFDEAESKKANLERYMDIFTNAHVYYRQVSKGQ